MNIKTNQVLKFAIKSNINFFNDLNFSLFNLSFSFVFFVQSLIIRFSENMLQSFLSFYCHTFDYRKATNRKI